MTEAQWLTCWELLPMLAFLEGKASDRKLRLLAVNSCRRSWELLIDPRSRNAVLVAERFADGAVTDEDLQVARAQAEAALQDVRNRSRPWLSDYCDGLEAAAENAVASTAAVAYRPQASQRCPARDYFTTAIIGGGNALAGRRIWEAEAEATNRELDDRIAERLWNDTRQKEWAFQACLLHCVFGRLPFRAQALDPSILAWHDGCVPKLAQTIYDKRAFEAMPLLADALEEAGCVDQHMLQHCRQSAEHVRGCSVVDLILRRE